MAGPNQIAMASNLIAQSTAQCFANNAAFTRFNYRGFEKEFYNGYYAPGTTVQVPLNFNNTIQRGYTVTAESLVTSHKNITLQPFYSFCVTMNTIDQYLSFSSDALKAAIRDGTASLISEVEADMCSDLQTQAYMYVDNTGDSGLVDNTKKFQSAGTRLFQQGVPLDGSWMQVLSGSDYDALSTSTSAGSLLNQFVQDDNQEIRRTNVIRGLGDFRTTKTQNIINHTAGAAAGMVGPIQIDGAVSSGNVLNLKGLTSGSGTITNAFKIGDRITLEGVKSINKSSRLDTNFDMTFVVTANANSDNAGLCSITVNPSINTDSTDPNRNLNSVIPNNTVVTVLGDHKVQPAYQERGLIFVSAPYAKLEVPGYKTYTDSQTGLTIACGIEGSLTNAQNFLRVFLLCGWVWLSDLVCINASSLL